MDAIPKAIRLGNADALKSAVRQYAAKTQPTPGAMNLGPGITVSPFGLEQRTILDNAPPWVGSLFYNVGNDCLRSEKYELAELMYREAISEGYDAPSAWNNIAVTFKRRGNYSQAVAEYTKLIARFPEYTPAYPRLAIMIVAYYGISEIEIAVPYIIRFLQLGGSWDELAGFVVNMPSVCQVTAVSVPPVFGKSVPVVFGKSIPPDDYLAVSG